MIFNNDNFEDDNFLTLNNPENNDLFYNNECNNFKPMFLDDQQNLIENKEIISAKADNSLSSEINKNLDGLIQNNYDNKSKLNHLETKSKKLFNILHMKRKALSNFDSQNKKRVKIRRISKDENRKLTLKKSLNSEKDSNENNSILKYSVIGKGNCENKNAPHNKFSDDNLRRKCKHIILFYIMEFINKKIYSMYEGNLGNNIYRKEILTLNKSQKTNSNISYNRSFVNKKISEILSDNISSRYTNFLPEHNKLLIERLKTDKDENKSLYFNKLFDLTFTECLDYFIGKITIKELNGMKRFENVKDLLGDDKEYINVLKYYFENFENIINNKSPRKPKNNKKSTSEEDESEKIL